MRQELLKLPDVTNANCWAHARCDYADAIKAADKSKPGAIKNSIVYQALERIGKFYEEDEKLKNLPSAERLQKRQLFINPLGNPGRYNCSSKRKNSRRSEIQYKSGKVFKSIS